jgi:hypothetical protein
MILGRKYMLSREVCLNSAFAFLEAFGGPVAPSVEARYWYVLAFSLGAGLTDPFITFRPQTYGLFTSSVILYLNLCRVPDDQVEKAASDVQRGINALRYVICIFHSMSHADRGTAPESVVSRDSGVSTVQQTLSRNCSVRLVPSAAPTAYR